MIGIESELARVLDQQQVQPTKVAALTGVVAIRSVHEHRETRAIECIMYAVQVGDAFRSANVFKKGMHELNPMMRPFSHGGAVTMMLGFAAGDLLRHQLFRRGSTGQKNTADLVQTLTNLEGIIETSVAPKP